MDSSSSSSGLPEAPQPAAEVPEFYAGQTSSALGTAPRYTMEIQAGWSAQRLNAKEKIILSLRDEVTLENLAGFVLSAGYSHLANGQPNYGTDRGAFGERLGAAALRSTSEDLFANAIFAPLLRQDPRYYVEGPSHPFLHRVGYAVMRPLITRTDSGRKTVNASLLLGYAGAVALTPLYYPRINRNFHDTAATYGGSLGGSALAYVFEEFSDQLLKAVHLKKQ